METRGFQLLHWGAGSERADPCHHRWYVSDGTAVRLVNFNSQGHESSAALSARCEQHDRVSLEKSGTFPFRRALAMNKCAFKALNTDYIVYCGVPECPRCA